ncbi:SDR family oxidoreductase [Halorarius halobius]|uniref:SDR family oxidoreductase n=1 Tax=Halorarius halobius TaxID=2962671 RepID=UPI0020CB8A13|nr:SDR family oxidoreductase [Halorarius halobius]
MPSSENVALVTGASSGVGEATARELAADGYRVVLAARREAALRDVADGVEAAGGTARVHPTDVTDRDAVADLVGTTVDEWGRIDAVVNNAGVMSTDPVDDADPEDWRRMVEVNLLGLMTLTREALPTMYEQGHGDVVFVSSVNARKSSPGGSGYCASKAGVNGFAESLRQEAADEEVRVTVIEPGLVATEMQSDEVTAEMPTLDPEAVARAVGYALAQPRDVAVGELLIRPTTQAF